VLTDIACQPLAAGKVSYSLLSGKELLGAEQLPLAAVTQPALLRRVAIHTAGRAVAACQPPGAGPGSRAPCVQACHLR